MASSTHRNILHLQTPYGVTSAPPPTPSTHSNVSSETTTHANAISNLLQRLPPTLTLPTRHRIVTKTPPLVSLSDTTSQLLTAVTQLGFFHLHYPHRLPSSNVSALFDLPDERKPTLFPNAWPLGYDDEDGESFCVNLSTGPLAEVPGLDWAALREFGLELERIGQKVVEELARVVGFKSPAQDETCSLMWISDGEGNPGRVYPYVIGLHCRVGLGKCSLLADSGWVDVSDREDSVLVTVGDVAQVWSNGKLKKVGGRPIASSGGDMCKSHSITLSLLISLPVESSVSCRLPGFDNGGEEEEIEGSDGDVTKTNGEIMQFRSFSFEDYAWRVYHECLLIKDPLVRYRV